jgi:hypothetical protein
VHSAVLATVPVIAPGIVFEVARRAIYSSCGLEKSLTVPRVLAAIISIIAMAAFPGGVFAAESRIALVIGNAAYQHANQLTNPRNDAVAMAATLKNLGFDVVAVTDADRVGMVKALADFHKRLQADGVGLFYYAGHGIQIRGRNYLIPVDAEIAEETDVPLVTLDLETVQQSMDDRGVRLSLFILDACRDSPFERRFRSAGSRGLAPVDAARGSLIAFATAPGRTAADGSGEHGLYTGELLKQIAKPGLELDDVLKQTAAGVEKLSGNQQTPWFNSAFHGHFYFAPVTINVTSPPSATPVANDVVFWEAIKASTDPADFEDFLRRFPQSDFASLAERRIVALRAPPPLEAKPAIVAPQLPPATPIPAGTFDGKWLGTYTCGPTRRGDAGFTQPILATVRDGNMEMSVGRQGNPGWHHMAGAVAKNGTIRLVGEGVSNLPGASGNQFAIVLNGSFEAGNFKAHGVHGNRTCDLQLSRSTS